MGGDLCSLRHTARSELKLDELACCKSPCFLSTGLSSPLRPITGVLNLECLAEDAFSQVMYFSQSFPRSKKSSLPSWNLKVFIHY